MSVEDSTDTASNAGDEPTPTGFFLAHQSVPSMRSGIFEAPPYMQQPMGCDQNRVAFSYVPSNIAGHTALPMGAFLMPPCYGPLGPFYPTPAIPYPFMLPVMAAASTAVSSDPTINEFPSGSRKAVSPQAEEGEKEGIKEDSDTESMSVAAAAGSSPPSPWRTAGPGATSLQASVTSNVVASPTDVPSADFRSTSTASVQSTQKHSKQPHSSLEELLRADGENTEGRGACTSASLMWTEPKPSSPQLAHFYQLVSRSKLAKFIQIRNLSTEGEVLTWLEITRKSCHIDSNLGPVNIARILVSSNGLCKLQLLYPYFKTISTRLMPADDEGVELLLSDLGPQNVLCPGLPDYEKKYDIIGYHVAHVRVMNQGQMKRYDHDNCLLWHVPANLFSPSGHHLHNMCQHCKYLENKLTKLCNRDKSQLDKKGSGRATATPPYDLQQRGQKQRKLSMPADARGLEACHSVLGLENENSRLLPVVASTRTASSADGGVAASTDREQNERRGNQIVDLTER